MSQIIRLNINEILPERASVLKAQGIPEGKPVPEKIEDLLEKAMMRASESIWPVAMISELTPEEFEPIFKGEGQNEPDTPMDQIFPRAEHLALFAVTLGSRISLEIDGLFKNNDFALATMLDSVASLAADKAVEVMEDRFRNDIMKQLGGKTGEGADLPGVHVLGYSPGYCGWHVSGQKKLFAHLNPGAIGISLNESFLMAPLKSVTGVLIAGPGEIHLFEAHYPFCKYCKDPTCIERRKTIQEIDGHK